jgi:glycosyltransferase involved in cell wall biosynthesis
MARLPLTVSIITLNEEQNILRALKSAAWADEILVVDSGSTDRTLEIARSVPFADRVRCLTHTWQGYGQQKNFAQDQASHNWVFNLDADEEISPELRQELEILLDPEQTPQLPSTVFQVSRKTYYLGQWIQYGGWYPNFLTRLADRRFARWTEPNVHEALELITPVKTLGRPLSRPPTLQGSLYHHAFQSIQEQVLTNLNFSRLGSADLRRRGQGFSLLKLFIKPIGKFIETYILKRGFQDGLAGFIISVNAAHSMFLKYAYLAEERIRTRANSSHETLAD